MDRLVLPWLRRLLLIFRGVFKVLIDQFRLIDKDIVSQWTSEKVLHIQEDSAKGLEFCGPQWLRKHV